MAEAYGTLGATYRISGQNDSAAQAYENEKRVLLEIMPANSPKIRSVDENIESAQKAARSKQAGDARGGNAFANLPQFGNHQPPDLSETSCCGLCCGCLCLTLCLPFCLLCSPFLCCYCCCCAKPNEEGFDENGNPIAVDESHQLMEQLANANQRQSYHGAEDVVPLARRGNSDSFNSGGKVELSEFNLAQIQSGA